MSFTSFIDDMVGVFDTWSDFERLPEYSCSLPT